MAKNYVDLAREINEQAPQYKIKDIIDILHKLEDNVVKDLGDGEEVKLGKLMKLELVNRDEKKAYDGINHRYYTIKASKRVTPKLLTRLSSIKLESEKE